MKLIVALVAVVAAVLAFLFLQDSAPDFDGTPKYTEASDFTGTPNFTGTWSDPPARAEDAFCHIGCLIEARDHLTNLLNDPALYDKTYRELRNQAQGYQITQLLPGYMTPEALARRMGNRDPRPVSAICEPWGLVRIALSPHALQITPYEDHISLQYSEWTALRHIYMDGREFPENLESSKYGYSIGHYEGEELVIETRGVISDNFGAGGFVHTDQANLIERYSRVGEDRLEVEVVLTDPLTFTQPLVMARAWAWAPGEEIFAYDNCVIPE
jgi:hypothetical protein